MTPSPTPSDRIDAEWVELRATLRRLLLEYDGVLPADYVAWGRLLIVTEDMAGHPFAPWREDAAWYLEQVATFINEARKVIERELAPYADAAPKKTVIVDRRKAS